MSLMKTGVKGFHHLKLECNFSLSRGLPQQKIRYLSAEVCSDNSTSANIGLTPELKKRIFNTVLWDQDPEVSFVRRKRIEKQTKLAHLSKVIFEGVCSPRPLALRFLDENAADKDVPLNENTESVSDYPPTYPYAEVLKNNDTQSSHTNGEMDTRKKIVEAIEGESERMKKWMSDYEVYDESQTLSDVGDSVNYGSSDLAVPVSKVPCGGCGALLQCQDHSIPGYLPKELFAGGRPKVLKSMVCQRCHFLKQFNVALDVNVSPEEYPKIISCIKDKRAMVVLMIDLLDFPCSIWPQIMDIIGTNRPVIIVGNKVDLIPGDHSGYMDHLKNTLMIYVEKMGIDKGNIKHVSLISSYTGFGVEDLITNLHDLWENKSDVFLLGCTNVGKSTLYNTLLQSDFCKTAAMDLVQKATTSIWPGTTLNLLRFPILRPEGWRLNLRRKRLLSENKKTELEKQLQKQQIAKQRMYHMPTFLQYVGKTFVLNKENQNDLHDGNERKGIDENKYEFAQGRWCYDTPGVMHPDQILNILTTEELMKVIPRAPIIPRFFVLKPGRSLFLAGLGRIDLLTTTSDQSARVAVFSSESLPVSIIQTHEAEEVYKMLLGSELMAVPCGSPQRLADWPGLQAKKDTDFLRVKGIGWKECCADIVLSSAGWVSVSGGQDMDMDFKVWTPFSRGIHLRQPALLPYAVNFRGKRIDHTPTYSLGREDGKSDIPMA